MHQPDTRPEEAPGASQGERRNSVAGAERDEDIVIAPSWRRSVLSILCCLGFMATGFWLVRSPDGVRQQGGWKQILFEKLGLKQPNPAPRPPVFNSTSDVTKIILGVLAIVPFGLVALHRGYELWRRPRWLITRDRIQCLIGEASLVVEILFEQEIAGIELVDLRPPEARKRGSVPLTFRPVFCVLSIALEVKHQCLGLRLADPEGYDRVWPRLAAHRARLRQQYGVDVLVPVSQSVEEAQAILEAVWGRVETVRRGRWPEPQGRPVG